MKNRGKIFIVEDDALVASMLSLTLTKEGYEVRSSVTPEDLIDKIDAFRPDVIILDINLPKKSGLDILKEIKKRKLTSGVLILTADDTAETAVKAMKLGAEDYITKPFNINKVKIAIKNIIEKERLKQEIDYLRKVACESFEKDIIWESSSMKEIKAKIEKIALAGVSTMLIMGESGTGKELLARYVHNLVYGNCKLVYAPFISVNCAALPETLLETELFGYEKGAFTDAKSDKKGLFELAEGGTLLLDEIGDMKHNLQSKLLRVLEERKFRRIGGKEEIPVNAIILATTNRNIPELVEKGDFRLDLFYRLNAFSVTIPPLRERRSDIPALCKYFLSYFANKYNNKTIKGFSSEAEELLKNYHWPGNVRELKNVVERIVVLESSEIILPEHLPKEILHQSAIAAHKGTRFILPDTGISLEEVEKDLFMQALQKAKNNKTLAAKLLNISYDTLRYQIKKFGLE